MSVRNLTCSDFTPNRGKAIAVQALNGTVQLVLAEVQELPGSARDGGGFRLEFTGPLQPPLGQGTYRFMVGGEPADIFIVPIGVTADAMRYEAIFF
jgi:hypothetical protein